MTSKKLSAYADSKIRVERGRGYPPLVASIHKQIAEKSGIRLGDEIHILTNGEKIVIRKNEVQKSNFSEYKK
jgi:anaerobic selenocysteine-containing dehydrogenase